MSKPKWQEPLEQWGGHFIALGVLGGTIFGPCNVALILTRELSKCKWVPWPYRGQFPPGNPFSVWFHGDVVGHWSTEQPESLSAKRQTVTQMDRVEDMRRDLIFQFSGYAVGQAIQIGLILWRLLG